MSQEKNQDNNTNNKLSITQIVKDNLAVLRARNQEIITKRFGLNGEKPYSLEKIGREFSRTRERIRQIESEILKTIKNKANGELKDLLDQISKIVTKNGGQATEKEISEKIFKKYRIENTEAELNNLKFVLKISGFKKMNEDSKINLSWGNNPQKELNSILIVAENILSSTKKIMGNDELIEKIQNEIKTYPKNIIKSMLSISKRVISAGPDKWGLASWGTINPKTIHDWTYFALKQSKKSLHTEKIMKIIEEKMNKKLNIKTVRNILISDKRFVLVGRGIYGLTEWGFKPGTVTDIIKKVLAEEGNPMESREIIKKVLEERYVKPNTILINLQSKPDFKKVSRATYALTEDKSKN